MTGALGAVTYVRRFPGSPIPVFADSRFADSRFADNYDSNSNPCLTLMIDRDGGETGIGENRESAKRESANREDTLGAVFTREMTENRNLLHNHTL